MPRGVNWLLGEMPLELLEPFQNLSVLGIWREFYFEGRLALRRGPSVELYLRGDESWRCELFRPFERLGTVCLVWEVLGRLGSDGPLPTVRVVLGVCHLLQEEVLFHDVLFDDLAEVLVDRFCVHWVVHYGCYCSYRCR